MFKLPIISENDDKLKTLYEKLINYTEIYSNISSFGNFERTDKTLIYSFHKVLFFYFRMFPNYPYLELWYEKSSKDKIEWLDNYFSDDTFDTLLNKYIYFRNFSTNRWDGLLKREFKNQIKKSLDSDDILSSWRSNDRKAFCYTVSKENLFVGLCVHKDDIKKMIYELALLGEIQDYSVFKMYIPDSTQRSHFREIHPFLEKIAEERDIPIIRRLPRVSNDKNNMRKQILATF